MDRKTTSSNWANEKALLETCPMTYTLSVIDGRWKPVILFQISRGVRRFSELEKAIPLISQKMLTVRLKELEKDQLRHREIFVEIPPRVEYYLTEKGRSLLPLLQEMNRWGKSNSNT